MSYLAISVALVFGMIAMIAGTLFARLWKFDQVEYEKSKSRYPSIKAAFAGKARVRPGNIPDGRVRAGMVFNYRTGGIEPNGQLNNDVIDSIIDR